MGAKAEGGISSVAPLRPRPELAASEADIAEIARHIDRARSVVIMCGAGCHGAAEELRALSDRLKAPLIHSVKGKDIMPYDDPSDAEPGGHRQDRTRGAQGRGGRRALSDPGNGRTR